MSLNVLFPNDTELLKVKRIKSTSSVFVKERVTNRVLTAPFPKLPKMSSAVCFPINSNDSQVDLTRSPCPEAAVTHTSVHYNISLWSAHVCFSLMPYGWVSTSENVGLIATILHSCSPDDSPQCTSEGGWRQKRSDDAEVSKVCEPRSLKVPYEEQFYFGFIITLRSKLLLCNLQSFVLNNKWCSTDDSIVLLINLLVHPGL